MLNKSKGAAVWGPRAQMDRDLYVQNMRKEIAEVPNLDIVVGSVFDIVYDDNNKKVEGVKLESGEILKSDSVVITTGTVLRG